MMMNPKVRLFAVLFSILLLAGCFGTIDSTPIVVTATSMPATQTPFVVTATPVNEITLTPTTGVTSTPSPTNIPSFGIDCFGQPRAFRVSNSNPCLSGQNVKVTIPTSDGRYQCVPNFYEPVVQPGQIGVPPYMNCNEAQYGNSIAIELTQIDGRFGLSTTQQFQPSQCYLLKITGALLLEQGSLNNLWMQARIGDSVLASQSFSSGFGIYEFIWPITVDELTTTDIEISTVLNWAEYDGTNSIRAFEVLEVPAGFCA